MKNTINWQRITTLNLAPLAMLLARRYGADFDEVLSGMILSIAERALEVPDFLDQTDSYIRQYAKWATLRRFCPYRSRWAPTAIVPLDGDVAGQVEAEEPRGPCPADLEAALMVLPGDLRDVAAVLLSAPERFLAGGHHGNVNKAALARAFNHSEWWARERLNRLQCALAFINGVSTVYEEVPE
jgi:hypothetical protein